MSSGQLEEDYSRLVYTENMETNRVSISHFINKVLSSRYSVNSLSIKKTRSPTSTDMLHQSGLSVVRHISSIFKNVNEHSGLVSEVI